MATERPLAKRIATPRRLSARLSGRVLPASLAAGLLVLVALVLRLWLAGQIAAPWIQGDELEYSELAKSFSDTGKFLYRDQPFPLRTLYAVLVSPAWLAHSMATTYTIVKTVNVVLMTLTAIPLFLWARRLVGPRHALLATLLFLLLPSFVYTGVVMTESAFLPAFVAAAFAIALALERPTVLRQLLVFVPIVVACAIRLQGVVLFVVLPCAAVLKALLDVQARGGRERGRLLFAELRRYWVSAAALVVLAVGYAAYEAVRGGSLASGFGAYSGTATVHYSLRDATRWIVYHFGELAFSVGMIPACALLVLLGLAWRRGTATTTAERAFLATATAAIVLLVIEVGAFASKYSVRVEERNMFYLAPLLLLAFVVWLARGLPRPSGLTVLAVLVPVSLLLAIPFEGLFNLSLYTDSFGLIPLYRLSQRLTGGASEVRVLVGLGALAAGVLFAVVPRRFAQVAAPAAVALFLALSSVSVFRTARGLSEATRHAYGIGADPSWVDHRIGRTSQAVFLYTSDLNGDPHVLWQTEFWNRSVGVVYGLGAQPPGIGVRPVHFDPLSGRILPDTGAPLASARYAVVDGKMDLAGRLVARPYLLALYRVTQPLRLASTVGGVYPDAWMGADATYTRYVVAAGRPGRITLVFSRQGAQDPGRTTIRIRIGPLVAGVAGATRMGRVTTMKEVPLRGGAERRVTLKTPGRPFRLELHADRTFSPAQFGSPDTRQLSARVTIAFSSR